MTTVVVTGAGGFLGWHVRVRLRTRQDVEVRSVTRSNWQDLSSLLRGADAVIHIAGVNRGPDDMVEEGNAALAGDLARAIRAVDEAGETSPTVIYANSIHSGINSPYGRGKARAAELLRSVAERTDATFVDVRLPNLFGEGGRPDYNSFVQTFVARVLSGDTPRVDDREIELLHAQRAADVLVDALDSSGVATREPSGTSTTVSNVLDRLVLFEQLHRTGDIPPILSDLDLDLFNTLRFAAFPTGQPHRFTPQVDHRGSLTEVVRVHGGQGQTFVSTTRPGVTRGEHFHLHKVERFVVLEGRARIALRRVLGDGTVFFDVDGDHPCAVDMPTLWSHNITNTGDTPLTTLFWTHELFDPANPDTYADAVGSTAKPFGGLAC